MAFSQLEHLFRMSQDEKQRNSWLRDLLEQKSSTSNATSVALCLWMNFDDHLLKVSPWKRTTICETSNNFWANPCTWFCSLSSSLFGATSSTVMLFLIFIPCQRGDAQNYFIAGSWDGWNGEACTWRLDQWSLGNPAVVPCEYSGRIHLLLLSDLCLISEQITLLIQNARLQICCAAES